MIRALNTIPLKNMIPLVAAMMRCPISRRGTSGSRVRSSNQRKMAKSTVAPASITDAKFSQDSPLSRLTEKQRRVLVTAYRLGYYDEPRRISSQELAKRMKVGSSTLINHRRRAERHLLAALVGD
ncbi:MAG: helix-turn-helix domain-containing protein [Thaumarchaeota archaeon]|nr:helix-turn-helix domain-containing protein [Nitrososphaerota archaeon]